MKLNKAIILIIILAVSWSWVVVTDGAVVQDGKNYVGLSSDPTPTNATNGSRFYETDTKRAYLISGGTRTAMVTPFSAVTGSVPDSQLSANFNYHNSGYLQANNLIVSGLTVTVPANTVTFWESAEKLRLVTVPVATWQGTLTAGNFNYVHACYSAGTASWSIAINTSGIDPADGITCISYAESYVQTGSTSAHNQLHEQISNGAVEAHHKRVTETGRYGRVPGSCESITVTSGTNSLAISGGYIYSDDTKFTIPGVTTATRMFACVHDSGGNWICPSATNPTVNTTLYDSPTGTLTVPAGDYKITDYYVGVEIPDHAYSTYSVQTFSTLVLAQAYKNRQSPPPLISSHAYYVGRVISLASTTTDHTPESDFTAAFGGSTTVTNHNSLAGIQGAPGAATGEHYHVNSAQATNVSNLGTISSSPSTDFTTTTSFTTHTGATGTNVHGLGTMASQAADSVVISGGTGTLTKLQTADGTVASPAISFTTSTNSGIYSSGANVRFSVSGVLRGLFNVTGLAVEGTLYPSSDNSRDMGVSDYRWKNLYMSGIASIPTLSIGGSSYTGFGTASQSAVGDFAAASHNQAFSTITGSVPLATSVSGILPLVSGGTNTTMAGCTDGYFVRKKTGSAELECAQIAGGGDMLKSENLSGLANYTTARNNLIGTTAGNALKVVTVNAGGTDYELATSSSPAPATTVTTQAYGDAGTVGTATTYGREDHKHGMPATTKDTTAVTGVLYGNGTAISAATWTMIPTPTKQTVSAGTAGTIAITGKFIEVAVTGAGTMTLPAGSYDGQELEVYVKSTNAVTDSLVVTATFIDGSTTYNFNVNPKGRGISLVYTTTATAGWTITAANSNINDRSTNTSTAAQSSIATTRVYVTGSRLVAPVTGFKIGTILRWTITATKTAAGTAAAVFDINFGTNGSTSDTARVTLTNTAQTAVIDTATFTITAVVRGPIGASTVVHGSLVSDNVVGTTGFKHQSVQAVSAGFDITPANTGAGICVTSGASAVWSIQSVIAEYITT